MRLFFLGTAAGEGYPSIFCECDNCREARARGGRNLRLRSALLVNDDLLLDMGPDLVAAAHRYNLRFSTIRTALITHAHGDHFHLPNIEFRKESFTVVIRPPRLNFRGRRCHPHHRKRISESRTCDGGRSSGQAVRNLGM